MFSYESPEDRILALQMNSELQHAHLELLSAHCAIHQLRLHYSTDDLARFGRRDVLRKSAEAAGAVHDFYAAIAKKIPAAEPNQAQPSPVLPSASPEQIAQAVEWLSSYLQEQREHYLCKAGPLSRQHQAMMWPYFSPELLDQIRVIELHGARVAEPVFFAQIRALGFEPPEVTHMDSLTFLDVVVFNQRLTDRSLFHGLVHAVQIKVLGLRRYAELWVQSFVQTRAHFTVPLEVHAFSLASKFLRPAAERFSVEDHVLRWLADGRY